jgi:putative oxidoreductase
VGGTDAMGSGLALSLGALTPFAETLLRAVAGLMLVPHGLRGCLGFFPNTGVRRMPDRSAFAQFAESLARQGYWPSYFWAALAGFTQLVAGPCMALGLFTHLTAFMAFCLLLLGAVWHRRAGHGYFWNTQGVEFPLMWALVALYFAAAGGGPWSLDRLIFAAPL